MSDPETRATADLIGLALDELVQLVIDAGVVCTRDPGDFQPPGAIVAAPTISGASTMQSLALDVPIYVVSDQLGREGLDWMLEGVSALLPALRTSSATPTSWASPINPQGLPAYLITATVNVSTS